MRRFLLAGAAALAFLGPACAEDITYAGRSVILNPDGSQADFRSIGSGGGGGGSTGGTVAQGAAGSAPWPAVVAQYNATLPTLSSGATGYLAVDSSGRLILAPGAAVTVSNAGTFAVQNTAATPAGTNIIGKVGIDPTTNGVAATEANGANAALGATTDAPITGAASTTAATLQAEVKGLYNLLQAGNARTATAQWWSEAASVSLASGGTFSGVARSSGGASGGLSPFGYFTATAYSSVAATLTVYNQTGGGIATAAAIPAGGSAVVKLPALGASFQTTVSGTSAAATINVADGFTVN